MYEGISPSSDPGDLNPSGSGPGTLLSRLSPDVREFLRYFTVSFLIFAGGCIGGFAGSMQSPEFGESLVRLFQEMITNEIMFDDPPLLALQLFLNNLEACVLLFLGGATFGLLTIFVLSFNGIVIGGILEVVRAKTDEVVMFAAIIPHGVFELPAVLVSATLGLMLSRAVMDELRGEGDAAARSLMLGRLFVRYVVPFIAFAACIEAFITPAVLQMVT